ncbi:HEAT repeat domain-containing protein [Streptomyces sp. NPDC058758]|uniref:HEAT repeat domain-containing protein n=1 Tax=Streptomyces sp. NPDC058758 TaxID=3346627 RepID=UPI00368B8371
MSSRTRPERVPSEPVSAEEALAVAVGGVAPDGWRDWPAEVLVPAVRVALLRAELVRDPGVLGREEPGEALYQAVRGVEAGDAGLVRAAAGSGDAVLEGEALRLAREGLRAGGLAPAFVRDVLLGLLGSAAGAVVNGALAELAEPWASVEPLPASVLAGLLGPETAGAALATAAAHGHGELLWRAAADPGASPEVRGRALALYGETARREDVPALLELAGTDPLMLSGPAAECLRAMHRRGHFATDADVPAVLALALADHTIPAGTVATVLFTARHALLRLLADAAPDDPAWPRRLDLLVALDAQGVGGLPVAAEIARVLPAAADPAPFLRALRALRDPGTEAAVLAALPHAPAAALDALEAVGGDRTVRVLGTALGLDGLGAQDPDAPPASLVERAVRPHRKRALELVWLLNTDPGVRRRLLTRVDAAELPARVAADLGGPDERELALLAAHLDPDDPVAALCRLAAHAGPGTLPVLADLLLRIAGEAAAAWEPGGTGPVPEAEPVVPQEAVDALDALGRRLHARGRIRPVCLLDVFPDDAGPALVTDLVLGLLDRPGLTAGEQAVLLRVPADLPRAPHRTLRSRAHPFLRHPDRHVRKHAVALLARDATGDGVEAVSATLLALTGPDRDPQTVRQALGALGGAGARWASDAIAGCLDHLAMNVRKAAAGALATAGTARAVPPLLRHLGHTDNPGLRALLLDALRALLGAALPATLAAAADGSTDARTRDRLLAALPGEPAVDRDEEDLRSLAEEGWDQDVALGLAERHAEGRPHRAARLRETRPHLDDWLALAAASGRARRAVLAVLPGGICPAPWTARERGAFARHVTVLLDGLAEAEGAARDALIEVLEAVATHRRPDVRREITLSVRDLPLTSPGRRSVLPLLRLAGAVVVRADLDRALDAAALAADPDDARARLLREAFGVDGRSERPPWHGELAASARSVADLAAHRRRGVAAGSRELLAALVDVQAGAPDDVRAALVDWMTDLQPPAAPPWTLAEDAARAEAGAPRAGRPAGPDRPRSAARRERLLALLASGDRRERNGAAYTLLGWPEPDARATVLDAYLRGRIDEPAEDALRSALGRALTEAGPARLLGGAEGARADRIARAAAGGLDTGRLPLLLPVLLHLWEHGPEAARRDAFAALRRLPADALAGHLEGRLATGEPGPLGLLAGRRLLRTPVLERLAGRHPEAGLVLVDGPLYGPEAAGRREAALRALRERAPRPSDPSPVLPYEEAVALLRSPDPRRVRRTLAHLTEHAAAFAGALFEGPLRELLVHPDTGVRLHAHRTARVLLDRDAHLRLTEVLLDDVRPDVVRGAVRVLSQARREPAVPRFVALLDHGQAVVRRAAETAVLRAGTAAVPALRRAASHARPDRRPLYEGLLARVREQEQEREREPGPGR